MTDRCPEPGFLDPDSPLEDDAGAALREVTDALGLTPVLRLTFAGITNAARAEAHFKQVRKAHVLGVRGSAKAFEGAAHASHRRSLDQIAAAIDAVQAARQHIEHSDDERLREVHAFYDERFSDFLKNEVVPDARLRLLDGPLAPTEAEIVYDALRAPAHATLDSELNRLQQQLGHLHELRSAPDRGVTVDDASGVSVWKKVAVVVGTILVRILLTICKSWLFIVCFFVELVWKLVERRVIRFIFRKCSDPRPIPNPT